MEPGKLQRSKQDPEIIVGMSMTVHIISFCAYTFLLVICSDRRKQLLRFLHGQGQKMET